MKTLEGQGAIVTGAGSGIGLETAKMLAAEGATVVVAGRRKPPLDAVAKEIGANGGKAVAHAVDLEADGGPAGLARFALDALKRVDILINNAGHSSKVRSIRWVSRKDWDSVLAVNLTAVYELTQAVLPGMLERGAGTIVTVSSLAALRATLVGGTPYSAAKAGVRNLMNQVHNTLRDRGIRATTIMPAEVDTPILDNRPLPPDAKGRATMMRAEDVARAIMLCVLLPSRTVIEEIVMSPTFQRDMVKELEVAAMLGAPPGAK